MRVDERFELLEELGAGGNATVHLARERSSTRLVALKRIKPELVHDKLALKRFEREVFAVASINSPHVVALYDFQMSGEDFFIAMEPVKGLSLRRYIGSRAWTAREIFTVAAQIAEALAAAHRVGIVHRDLKPENIMLARSEQRPGEYRVKVLDFGFAKVGDLESKLELSILTRLGTTLGTPQYMSPEQCGGKPLMPTTDLFSLGVIVYEMLAATPPWDHRQPFHTMTAVVNEPPPPLKKQPAGPHAAIGRYKELTAFFDKALAKNPADRPRDATSFIYELGRALFAEHAHDSLAALAEAPLFLDAPPSEAPAPPASLASTNTAFERTVPIDASAFVRSLERGGPLIVSSDERTRVFWMTALAVHHPTAVSSLVEAKEAIRARRYRAVLIDLRVASELSSLDMFGDDARILLAEHAELPNVVRLRFHEQVAHVFPRNGAVENLLRLLDGAREADVEPALVHDAIDEDGAFALLRETVRRAARIAGAVIRPLDTRERLEVQLVLPAQGEVELFHRSLPASWGWPIGRQDSPAVRAFGPLDDDQDLFLRAYAVNDAEHAVHVAFLPWKSEDHLTLVLGVYSPDDRERHVAFIEQLHALACREVREFVLTRRPERAMKTVYHSVRYDWVVTERYVGRDRRKQDTSLLNRFVMFGKRQLVADQIASRSGGFIDRFPRWSRWYLACFVLLSSIDAYFTFRFVGSGVVRELNPLLRPLIGAHPFLFLLTKNAFAFIALFIVLRLHLFRVARYLLPGTLAIYLALDLYWLWLLFTKHAFQ